MFHCLYVVKENEIWLDTKEVTSYIKFDLMKTYILIPIIRKNIVRVSYDGIKIKKYLSLNVIST